MAVFRQEMNWSTYQDKQLQVLQSIERSFTSSLSTSRSIGDNLSKLSISIDTMIRATSTLASSITLLHDKLAPSTKAYAQSTQAATNALIGITGATKQTSTILDQYGQVIANTTKNEINRDKEKADTAEQSNNSIKQSTEETVKSFSLLSSAFHIFFNSLTKAGQRADSFLEQSNRMMTFSGLGYDIVKDFKDDLVNIVSDLNSSVGKSYYNSLNSYKQIVALSQTVTTNTESLSEMTRPLLLAQETTDVNLTSIATLFNRFYTRYTFSSLGMEEMVNDIRKYSAGSSANGEEIVQVQQSLADIVEYYAQGNQEKLVSYNEELAKIIGFTENTGLGNNANLIVDLMKKLEGGEFLTDPSMYMALSNAGLTPSQVAVDMKDPSKWMESIVLPYFTGIANTFKSVQDSELRDTILKDAFNIDSDQAMAITNWINSMTRGYGSDYIDPSKVSSIYSDYVNTRTDVSPEELVAQKYVSATQRVENVLTGISSMIADIQKNVGISITDITSLVWLGRGAGLSLSRIFSGLGLGSLVGSGGLSSLLKGSNSLLATIGSGLGVGALAAAGVALVVTTISTAVNDLKSMQEAVNDDIYGKLRDEEIDPDTSYGINFDGNLNSLNTGFVRDKEYKKQDLENLVTARAWEKYDNSGLSRTGSVGDFFANIGKGLVGSGWWSGGDASWTDYLPLGIGSAIRGVSNTVSTSHIDETVEQKDKVMTAINNMNSIQADAYNKYKSSSPNATSEELEKMTEAFVEHMDQIKTMQDFLLLIQSGQLPMYDIGTNYIAKDHIALVHKGEAIVPEKYNPAANVDELESLREHYRESKTAKSSENNAYFKEFISTLNEIKEFLKYWKDDNVRRENINLRKSGDMYRKSLVAAHYLITDQ